MCPGEVEKWAALVPSLEFAFNNSRHDATGQTPFFLLYGRHPTTPAALLAEWVLPPDVAPIAEERSEELRKAHAAAKESLDEARRKMKEREDAKRRDHQYKVGDRAFAKADLLPLPSDGPKDELTRSGKGPSPLQKSVLR